uniref:Uncharacterized protein n=1 Tax=Arundo donax TaxID=35708 RepID=A0A0A8Y9Z3_ARUDO
MTILSQKQGATTVWRRIKPNLLHR